MDEDVLEYLMRDFCFFSPIKLHGIKALTFKNKADDKRLIFQLDLKDKQLVWSSQFTDDKTEWQELPDGYRRITSMLIDPKKTQYEIGIYFVDTDDKTEWQELPDGYCFSEYVSHEERVIGMAFKERIIDNNSRFAIYLNPENEEQIVCGYELLKAPHLR